MGELTAVVGLLLAGWLVVRSTGETTRGAVALALPVGTAVYVSVLLVVAATGASMAHPWVVLGIVVAGALLFGRRSLAELTRPGEITASIVVVIGVGLTVLAARATALVAVSADSFRHLTLAGVLAQDGAFDHASTFLLESRGLATGSLHALAEDDLFLAALTPLFALSILAILWETVRRYTSDTRAPVAATLVAAGAVLLLAVNERFLFHAVYLNGHLFVAGWLLVLQVHVLRLIDGASEGLPAPDAIVVGALATGITTARPEGAILAGLVLLPAMLSSRVSSSTRTRLLLALGIPAIVWHGAVLVRVQLARAETPTASATGLAALGLVLLVLASVPRLTGRIARLPRVLVAAHAVTWAGLMLLVLRDPGLLFYSARATWRNVLYAGGWGNTLVLLGIIVAVTFAFVTWRGDRALAFTLFTFVPMSLVLAYLRGGAYRVGPGDSLNRSLMHVVPIAVLTVAMSASGQPRPWWREQLNGAVGATLTMGMGILLVVATSTTAVAQDPGLPPGGTFVDDDGNVHEGNIEAIAAERVTLGCDPPTNGRFCPDGSVTRGQMAAFLERSLNLPATMRDHFTDDDGGTFEAAINAMAEAGITRGCNPPRNDRFCPHQSVTRGQMAAFLARAFSVPGAKQDHFMDDEGSAFEAAINAIREVRYTHGCNPPANDRYCPGRVVHRDEMSSFLGRALALEPNVPRDRDLRHVFEQDWTPFADVGGVILRHPSPRVERVGFHQSNHEGARQMDHRDTAGGPVTMESRGRGTGSRTAADVVVDPDVAVRTPVTGTVKRAGTYVLYCQYSDDYAVIEPDSHPGWEVKVLHIDGVRVKRGDRVKAGVTVLAPRATVLPFRSQVDDTTANPSWPHVHLEVVDPSIPNEPSGGGC